MPSGPPIFEVQKLRKAFGTNVLLDQADLTVQKGEVLAIIGESGSGKSVLLKTIIGLEEPDDGIVLFEGKDVFSMDQTELDRMRQRVGYVFQNDALFDSMTVLDNIGYSMREHTKATEEEIRTRALECLEMVGIEAFKLEQYPAELSGGQRKRIGIARAVATKPEIILYDEPTQGLDPQSITRINEMIVRLQDELQCTSVIVTHDLRTAFSVCHRIALLHEGRFEHVGTPKQFALSKAEPVVEFIEDALEELPDLRALREQAEREAQA